MSAKATPDIAKDDLPVQEEEIAKSQEDIPWPFFAGTRLIALRWMSGADNRLTVKAKTPGGKK